MTFGEQVIGLLRERGLLKHLLDEEIEALKGVRDAACMQAFFSERGRPVEDERTEALHFADMIEIHVLRKRLSGATGAVLFFAFP